MEFTRNKLAQKEDKWGGLAFLLTIFIIYKVALIFVKMAYFNFMYNDSNISILFLIISAVGLFYYLFLFIRALISIKFGLLYILGGSIIIYVCNYQFEVVPNVSMDYNEYTNDLIDIITVCSILFMTIYLFIYRKIKLRKKKSMDDFDGEMLISPVKNQLDLF